MADEPVLEAVAILTERMDRIDMRWEKVCANAADRAVLMIADAVCGRVRELVHEFYEESGYSGRSNMKNDVR